jgi:peptide/nickel transport system substrate-binding protein
MREERENYWSSWRRRRSSRRTVLRGGLVGAAGLGAYAAIGCGDDDDDGDGGAPAATATTAGGGAASPAASPAAAQPKRGGTWNGMMAGDPTNIDPFVGTALPTHQTAGYVYSHLYRYKGGPGVDPGAYSQEPDLAEAAPEITPDGLTYTVKLKKNTKWHAPISRPVDAEDVVFSWKRYIGEVQGTAANPNATAIKAYLDSVTAVDPTTISFKMKTPRGEFLQSESKFLFIMPKETGTAFDPAQKLVGSGAWIFETYQPGSLLKFKRNPEWHLGPEAPYFDNVEINLIPEYATRLNQFLGGKLDEVDLAGNDLQRARDTVKGLQLYVGGANLPNSIITFSDWSGGTVPWKDPRVRKAISMSFDRDALLDAAYNLKDIEKLNLGTKRRWNNDIGSFDTAYWLDPQGKVQTKPSDPKMTADNMKSFQFNIAEAKKLLEAAGLPNGFKAKLYTTSSRYGQGFNILSELTQQYAGQVGIDLELNDVDYSSVYITQIVVQKNFEGLLHIPKRTGIRGNLEGYYLPGQIANYSKLNDPELNKMIEEMLREKDTEKARLAVLNIQNYTNDKMYNVPMQLGAAGGYIGYSPTVRNVLEYQVNGTDQGNETIPYYFRA